MDLLFDNFVVTGGLWQLPFVCRFACPLPVLLKWVTLEGIKQKIVYMRRHFFCILWYIAEFLWIKHSFEGECPPDRPHYVQFEILPLDLFCVLKTDRILSQPVLRTKFQCLHPKNLGEKMRGWKWLLSFTLRLLRWQWQPSHLSPHTFHAAAPHPFAVYSQCLPLFPHSHPWPLFLITLPCVFIPFADHPTPSHSAVSVSHSAFLDDEEFSDFMQGPVETPKVVPQSTSQPFHPATEAGQLLSERAVLQPVPPAQAPVLSILHGTTGQVPYFPTSASPSSTHKPGNSKVSSFSCRLLSYTESLLILLGFFFFQSVWKKYYVGN